jgi:sugar phosphate permease
VYTLGVFLKPLAAEFHTSRRSIVLAASVLDLVVALSATVAGSLVDRVGARRVIVTSIVALASCLAGLAFVEKLGQLYVLYGLAGLVGVASSPIAYGRVLANWFDRRRGLALGIGGIGIGIGAFVLPSLVQHVIDASGWRRAYLVLAALTFAIAMPVVATLLRGRPADVGLAPDGDARERTPDDETENENESERTPLGMSLREAIATRTFWQLFAIFFCVAACAMGTIANLASLVTDAGASARSGALATSLFGIATLVGRVGNGWLCDRFFAPRVAATAFGAAAFGIALLAFGASGVGAYAASLLLGFALGAETDVMPYLVSRYFGMRSMAALYGAVFAAFTLGNAAGRYAVAAGFDVTGSYRVPLAIASALLGLATVATLALKPYARVRCVP